MNNCLRALAATLVLLVAHYTLLTTAFAQQKTAPGTDQIRRLQDAQQRLTAEKNRLAAEKSKLEDDIKRVQSDAEAEKQSSQKAVAAQRGAVNKLNGRIAELEKQLQESQTDGAVGKERIASLTQRVERSELTNEQLRTQVQRLEEVVRTRDQALAQSNARGSTLSSALLEARKHNAELVKVSRQLLDAYDNKGLSEVIKQREAVLGIGRVAIENQLQSFSEKIEDNIVH